METITKYPASYSVSGSISGSRYRDCIGKGSSATASGNDYSGSSGSTATITYAFDFSDIPGGAAIESVAVKVGGHAESSTYNSSKKCEFQLYSGNTAKGEMTHFTQTSKQVVTMVPGTWTRDELQQAQLRVTIGYYGGLVNGVDFTVTYTEAGTGAMIKLSSAYVVAKKLLRKSSDTGAYEEITKDDLPERFLFRAKDEAVTFLASDGGYNTSDGRPLHCTSTGNWEETYTSKFTGKQIDALLTQAQET